jgi:hypothetical protein
MMTASKKVRHVIRFRILFHFLFLSLATGTGKGDTPKGMLLREGSGPRAPLLIKGSKAGVTPQVFIFRSTTSMELST